jgi:hypothetical protein
MEARTKRIILENRLALLRGHFEHVGDSQGFRRELSKAQDELQQLNEQQSPGKP